VTAYWPTAESDPSATPAMLEFARIWKDLPKIVFSRTLISVGWNRRLVRDDPVEEVRRLKAQPGFDMDVGGPTIAAPLIRAGLIDEYRLFMQPVVLGAGTPFFPGVRDRIDLRLVENSDVPLRCRLPPIRDRRLGLVGGQVLGPDEVRVRQRVEAGLPEAVTVHADDPSRLIEEPRWRARIHPPGEVRTGAEAHLAPGLHVGTPDLPRVGRVDVQDRVDLDVLAVGLRAGQDVEPTDAARQGG